MCLLLHSPPPAFIGVPAVDARLTTTTIVLRIYHTTHCKFLVDVVEWAMNDMFALLFDIFIIQAITAAAAARACVMMTSKLLLRYYTTYTAPTPCKKERDESS